MTSLSTEKNARARYIGFEAARTLTENDSWKAFLKNGGERPPTLCIRISQNSFPGDASRLAAESTLKALSELAEVREVDLRPLYGAVFTVTDERVSVWTESGTMPADTLQDAVHHVDRRTRGGVFLVLSDKLMGETLLAAGDAVDATIPPTPADWFKAWWPDGEDNPRRLLQSLQEEVKESASKAALFQLANQHPSEWYSKPWLAFAQALAQSGGLNGNQLGVDHANTNAKQLLSLLRGETSKVKKATSSTPSDTSLVAEILGSRPFKDTGLEMMQKNASRWPLELRRERVKALDALYEVVGDADFNRIAPVPGLGAQRPEVTPGIPIQEAVWTIRALQECFPGRLSAREDEQGIRVKSVAFALPGSVDESGAAPPELATDSKWEVYPNQNPDLAGFGRALFAHLDTLKRFSARDNHYCVVISADINGEPCEISFGFGWRWGKPPASRADTFNEEQQKLKTLTEQLENLLPKAAPLAKKLKESWNALPTSPPFEWAGLTTPTGTLSEVSNVITAWNDLAFALDNAFGTVGNLAHRVASGPLDTFLDIGVTRYGDETDRFAGEAVRVWGYHPLRLQRQVRQERAAIKELHECVQTPATLRDVPLSLDIEPGQVPATLWPKDHAKNQMFLVPTERENPWTDIYAPFAHAGDREPDLIVALRPLLSALARVVMPGMRRRAAVRIEPASKTAAGVRPLLLLADLLRDAGDGAATKGIDIYAPAEVPANSTGLAALHSSLDLDLGTIEDAMTRSRTDEPRMGIEVRPHTDTSWAHIALLIRPFGLGTRRIVREQDGQGLEASVDAMCWDPVTLGWDRRLSSGTTKAEKCFDTLVVRRLRGESDQKPRVLGLSLEADPEHPAGRAILATIKKAACNTGRVVVCDTVWGPEAVASTGLAVTYADFHRPTGWRITVLAIKEHADREREAAASGAIVLFPGLPQKIADICYASTYRAIPEVTRELWRLHQNPEHNPDAERIGHLGVAQFIHPERPALEGHNDLPKALTDPFPEETVLLSMDRLQRWTWTRRGGTRGDFLAVFPDNESDAAWLVAIESKGSGGTGQVDGTRQARAAKEKLQERFEGDERQAERRELLRCIAEEAFRAAKGHATEVLRRVSAGKLRFGAVCVSTSRNGAKFETEVRNDVLWVRCQGVEGLKGLFAGKYD